MADIRRAQVVLLCASLLLALGLVAGCDSDKRPAAPVVDTTPPAIPDGLAASLDGSSVLLAWDANVTDPDLAGYVVYRSESEDGGFLPLFAGALPTNSWQDDSTDKGHIYYYRVAAIDASDNESGMSFTFRMVVPKDSVNRHRGAADSN